MSSDLDALDDDTPPMSDLDRLDALEAIMDPERAGEAPEGYMLQGALILALYVSPDGSRSYRRNFAFGAMDGYRQIGVLDSMLDDLRNSRVAYTDDDEDSSTDD